MVQLENAIFSPFCHPHTRQIVLLKHDQANPLLSSMGLHDLHRSVEDEVQVAIDADEGAVKDAVGGRTDDERVADEGLEEVACLRSIRGHADPLAADPEAFAGLLPHAAYEEVLREQYLVQLEEAAQGRSYFEAQYETLKTLPHEEVKAEAEEEEEVAEDEDTPSTSPPTTPPPPPPSSSQRGRLKLQLEEAEP
ncbi:hypothetical protein BT69DRAFT_1339796 [Atractiella rhizophila]|nr:hypothetical protein BT69DRAFT_1339796 [Atractiella rhizophila]